MSLEWVPLVSLIVSALAIPTALGMVWKDIRDRRKENSKEKKEEQNKAFKAAVRDVVQAENKPIKESINEIKEAIKLVSNGTVCTLRNDIKNNYYDCLDKGYRNDYDFKNIHDLYDAYVDLGGNSFITDVMVRFEKLPTKDSIMRNKEQGQEKKSPQNKNTRIKITENSIEER